MAILGSVYIEATFISFTNQMNIVTPHIAKVHKFAYPYYQVNCILSQEIQQSTYQSCKNCCKISFLPGAVQTPKELNNTNADDSRSTMHNNKDAKPMTSIREQLTFEFLQFLL